jgi:signal transduction histidine kinase
MGVPVDTNATTPSRAAIPTARTASPGTLPTPLATGAPAAGAARESAGRRTTVLLVEDNPADARLILLALPASEFAVTHVECLADATDRLEVDGADVVLLDLSLPDGEGAESIAWILAAAPGTPVVVLTGLTNDQVALRAVRAGVQDYLVKDRLDGEVLPRTIRHAIERERLLGELDALRRRQLETKDQLLSNVSHELRTPLNAVYQFLMLLIDEIAGPLTADQREYLEITRRNIGQLRAMIGDLLDATRIESGTLTVEPVATPLARVAEDSLVALTSEAAARGVALRCAIPDDLPALDADPLRLRQIVINLVHNGIKFTPAGGHVLVAAALDSAQDEFVRVRVTDTGSGIGPRQLSQIFERFHPGDPSHTTTSRKGLGLGLTICRELVRLQHGRIWVENTSTHGTTFAFVLPVWRGARRHGSARAAERKDPARRCPRER